MKQSWPNLQNKPHILHKGIIYMYEFQAWNVYLHMFIVSAPWTAYVTQII